MLVEKNMHGKYFGKDICMICGKEYEWEEEKDAEIIVSGTSSCNKEVSLDLIVITRCPHCQYKLKIDRKVKYN